MACKHIVRVKSCSTKYIFQHVDYFVYICICVLAEQGWCHTGSCSVRLLFHVCGV